MAELEVKENRFYLLRVKQEDMEKATLHSEIGSSISRIRDSIKSGVNTDNIELVSIEMKGDF